MERKEVDTQQFIDHTLLATELMHNNFMMDLMDQTGVFPKAEGPTNLSTTNSSTATGSVGYVEKHHTLTPPELNFHNSIFQFVNKHVVDEPNATRSSAVPASPEERTRSDNYAKETDVEFLTLNDVVPQQGSQPAFPALAIEPTVPIDVACPALQDDELLYAHSVSTTNARKVLPHKKRISRKLKGSLVGMETELEQHKHQHHVQVPVVAPYSCEICGYAVHTQIEFYAHLKEHYDPSSIEQPQQQQQQPQQQQQQQQKEPLDMCGLSAQDKLQQEQAKLDQVFHDVQLNFENFHNISHVDDDVVDDVGVNMVIHSDAISLHKTDDKLTSNVGTTNATTTNDVPNVVDDVEFSDTEDMLEGIRNVVDKVSIEDTCDELVDLELTTSGMRAPWFNNNFSDIAFSGLLLPGEPPPPTTTPPSQIQDEQIALHFEQQQQPQTVEQQPTQQHQQSKLEMCHKKHYIETTQANEADEQDKEQTLPARTPTPSATGSSIEQLQRSPLMISDSFKLEEPNAEATDSMPSSPAASAMDDNAEMYLLDMEADKQAEGDDGDGDANELKRKFRCTKCARDFNSYNALKYHQFTHTKERAFVCISCDRAFYTQGALKAHARTHSGLKPYKCEQCDQKFRQWGDLKYHTDSKHSDIKAHMCEFCGKSFSRKYSLVVHRRIHTCERNYACQYCDKTFRASSYLVAHIKIHTGEKPYACSICDKKFRVNGDLKRHARIHEPGRGVRLTPQNNSATSSGAKKRGSNSKLKQIEDEDDDEMNMNNKSDAVCGDNEQEILGL
ncbi:hypothetical protein KR093_009377 [Drosophila rubida]|uniref:C2H2-type domain-containing protein n=1 Tax=Drosophila rubida TaxID=30044 RepID=A0AAD4K5U9_9MUSC|nr:hypothetical protein KR093_009377 [Drosophila rubida]